MKTRYRNLTKVNNNNKNCPTKIELKKQTVTLKPGCWNKTFPYSYKFSEDVCSIFNHKGMFWIPINNILRYI